MMIFALKIFSQFNECRNYIGMMKPLATLPLVQYSTTPRETSDRL